MKLNRILLAALAAASMGQAMANVTSSQDTSTLLLMVGDENHSYLFDTGLSMSAIAAGTVNTTFTLPNWSQFNFAATTPFDDISSGVRWGLQTGTQNGKASGASMMISGSMDALNDGTISTDYSNGALKLEMDNVAFYVQKNVNPVLVSGAANVASSSDAFANDTVFNRGYGGNLNDHPLLAGSGNSLGLYLETNSSIFSGDPVNFTQMAEVASLDTSTGKLTIAVAAVPEPETYALMLAGLTAVCFVARRRRSV